MKNMNAVKTFSILMGLVCLSACGSGGSSSSSATSSFATWENAIGTNTFNANNTFVISYGGTYALSENKITVNAASLLQHHRAPGPQALRQVQLYIDFIFLEAATARAAFGIPIHFRNYNYSWSIS